jgi:hypothetical protein
MASQFDSSASVRQLSQVALLALAAILLSQNRSAASCWASNPARTRRCARFLNRYGGIERLCEDKFGDCASIGYVEIRKPWKSTNDSIVTRLSERSPASSEGSRPSAHPEEVAGEPEAAPTIRSDRADFSTLEHIPSELISFLYDTQLLIAVTLIASLFVTGMVLLPPNHRFIVYKAAKTLGLIMVAALRALPIRRPIAKPGQGPTPGGLSSHIPPPAAPTAPSSSSQPGLGPRNGSSPQLIGARYRRVGVLGEGGMKRVYLAEDTKLRNRQCAIAELLDVATDPAQQQVNQRAFEQEVDLLLELDS